MADIQRAIETNNVAYVGALKAGNALTYGDLFAVDGISLPASAPPVRGRAAIVSAMRSLFSRVSFVDGRLRTEEVHVIGDVAYELGTYWYVLKVGASSTALAGRYFVLWRHVEGRWKIALESSQPRESK